MFSDVFLAFGKLSIFLGLFFIGYYVYTLLYSLYSNYSAWDPISFILFFKISWILFIFWGEKRGLLECLCRSSIIVVFEASSSDYAYLSSLDASWNFRIYFRTSLRNKLPLRVRSSFRYYAWHFAIAANKALPIYL